MEAGFSYGGFREVGEKPESSTFPIWNNDALEAGHLLDLPEDGYKTVIEGFLANAEAEPDARCLGT
jgi:hypothetical protein